MGLTPAANTAHETPLWVKHSRVLWVEDELRCHDRELDTWAWERLFGESFDDTAIVSSYDMGDAIAFLMPNNHVLWWTCCGSEIHRPAVLAAL